MVDQGAELRASAVPGTHVGDCMLRAANEIERLRAALSDFAYHPAFKGKPMQRRALEALNREGFTGE